MFRKDKPGGCSNGDQCKFCHLCGLEELKRRKKDRFAKLKAEKVKAKENKKPKNKEDSGMEPSCVESISGYAPEASPSKALCKFKKEPSVINIGSCHTNLIYTDIECSRRGSFVFPAPVSVGMLAYVQPDGNVVLPMGSPLPNLAMS